MAASGSSSACRDTPEFEAWRERQRHRKEREKQEAAARAHDKT